MVRVRVTSDVGAFYDPDVCVTVFTTGRRADVVFTQTLTMGAAQHYKSSPEAAHWASIKAGFSAGA